MKESAVKQVDSILAKNSFSKSKIIPVMQDIQVLYGYLPEDKLRYISEKMGIPVNEIYSIATFYKSLNLKPRGKNIITVCLGTACHVKGGPGILQKIQEELCLKPGETTPDGLFTLETVNCLGACALGPLAVVNGTYYVRMDAIKIKEVVEKFKSDSGVKDKKRNTGSAEKQKNR